MKNEAKSDKSRFQWKPSDLILVKPKKEEKPLSETPKEKPKS